MEFRCDNCGRMTDRCRCIHCGYCHVCKQKNTSEGHNHYFYWGGD